MTQPNLRLVEGTSVDKTKALDAALSQIERAFGKGSIMRLGKNQKAVEIETVPRLHDCRETAPPRLFSDSAAMRHAMCSS